LNHRHTQLLQIFRESRAFIHNLKPDSLHTYIQARASCHLKSASLARDRSIPQLLHATHPSILGLSRGSLQPFNPPVDSSIWSLKITFSSNQDCQVSSKTTTLCQVLLQHLAPLSPWVVIPIPVCLLPLLLSDLACQEVLLLLSPLQGPPSSAVSDRTPMLPRLKPSGDSLVLPQEPGLLPQLHSPFKCLLLCLLLQVLPMCLFLKVLSSMELLLPSGLLPLCRADCKDV